MQATTQTKELTIFNRVLAIGEYSATQQALAELDHKFKDVIFPVETNAGMKDAVEARKNLKKLRTTLEAKRKEIKEPALRRSQAIDSEARDLTAAIKALEDPIDKQIKDQEEKERLAEEKRKRDEKVRVDGIQGKIAAIRSIVDESVNDSTEDLQASIDDMEGWTIGDDDGFAEFIQDARATRDATLTKLRAMHATAAAREQLAAEQAEFARKQAEFEKQIAEFEAMQRAAAAPAAPAVAVELQPVVDEVEDLFDRSEHPPLPNGQYYHETLTRDDGQPVLMNANGTRSVFCDVDEEPQTTPAARKPAFVPSFARTNSAPPAAAADQFVDVFDEPAAPQPAPVSVRTFAAPLYPNQAPAGYWMDGEYWGPTPEGLDNAAASFAETGTPIKLVPFWTHNQEVEFTVSMVNGKLRVVPASDEAAALLRSPFDLESSGDA